MKSSIFKEAINTILVKKPATEEISEWTHPENSRYSSSTSSANSTSNSTDTSPTGSTQNSRKNSPIPDEAKPSTLKKKSRYIFYTTSLVEHKIVQPGSQCLPFPWTHDRNTKTTST